MCGIQTTFHKKIFSLFQSDMLSALRNINSNFHVCGQKVRHYGISQRWSFAFSGAASMKITVCSFDVWVMVKLPTRLSTTESQQDSNSLSYRSDKCLDNLITKFEMRVLKHAGGFQNS